MKLMLTAGFIGAMSLTACGGLLGRGGSSDDYQISINRETYVRGNTGEATIRNVSDKTLEYNLCPRRLERYVNKYWVVAFEWPTAGGACTLELRRLNKGESINTLFEIPTGVPTGRYRVLFTGIRGEDNRITPVDKAATPSFDVR